MPAIDPTRLRRQSAEVVAAYGEPRALIRRLHELLDFYADRTRRPGETGTPPPLIHSYQVAQPVMRQLLKDLHDRQIGQPRQASLTLADALWQENNLECRILAIHLLSWNPAERPQPVYERVRLWARPDEEEQLLDLLLNTGMSRYRADAHKDFLRLVKDWLTDPDLEIQVMGLKALIPLAKDPNFKNLPQIYTFLKSPTQRAPIELRAFLLDLIEILAQRSPNETAYFLRESLVGASGTGTAILVRKSLDLFQTELQNSLRQALKEKSEEN